MGISDFIDKAKEMIGGNKDTVKGGIDQAGDVADDKTGGKYSDQIDQGADKAKDIVEDLDNE